MFNLWGFAGGIVDEESPTNPVTAYGWSKIKVEDGLRKLADDDFSPILLRNATAYGASPRLRADLVINNLVGYAVLQGRVLMKSDGTPWRPLIHIEDISRVFAAVLLAPQDRVHSEVFNVAVPGENYQIRDYRVDPSKILDLVPEFEPAWNVGAGVREIYRSFVDYGTDEGDFLEKLLRIRWLQKAQSEGRISRDLRVLNEAKAQPGSGVGGDRSSPSIRSKSAGG